ncbi:hypothetical protein PAXINDRAFT_152872 [Paxillus involutus ATCC 200175]|nr:hypothetical protein PAXINDRAFT_152872 [Paxillus involutus ATCC 200175]
MVPSLRTVVFSLGFIAVSVVAQCPSGTQFKCCYQSQPGSDPAEITLMQNYGVDNPTNESKLVGLGCSDARGQLRLRPGIDVDSRSPQLSAREWEAGLVSSNLRWLLVCELCFDRAGRVKTLCKLQRFRKEADIRL